jgi:hypothetical protein
LVPDLLPLPIKGKKEKVILIIQKSPGLWGLKIYRKKKTKLDTVLFTPGFKILPEDSIFIKTVLSAIDDPRSSALLLGFYND